MDGWLTAADIAVGLSVLGCSLFMVAPAAMRALLAVAGLLWLLETVLPSLVGLHRTALAICLLAFPSGRLDGRVR